MSSAALNPERNYNWPPAPAPANLTREIWNTVFASVGGRLTSLEAVATGIEQIQNELQQFGLARLDEAIVPLIKQVREELAKLDADVATAKQSNAASVVEFEAAVKAARAEIDVLLAGGLSAEKVTETVTRLFLTADERAEIAKLKAADAAMSDAGKRFVGLGTYDAMFEAITRPATNTKRGVVFFANESETIAGTDDISAITPKALRAWAEDWIKAKGLGAMDYSRTGWVHVFSYSWLESRGTDPNTYGVGTGEDLRYTDIKIMPVSDYRKCVVFFKGGGGIGVEVGSAMSSGSQKVTARLISNNTLRLSTNGEFGRGSNPWGIIAGRWTVGAPS